MYNPFTLQGKTILVTGASSGIGRAAAIECSRMGARVIVTGRDEERLKETLGQLEGEGHAMIVADLSDDAQLDRLVEQTPVLDGLVNNAGINDLFPVLFINREELSRMLEINTVAPILLMQRLLRKKKLVKGASVVFTSSISGKYIAAPGNTLYSTSKSAICGFVKNAALELAARQIRVNSVCPGMIETHILDGGMVTKEDLDVERQQYPLKRFGRPEEVAYGIVYLLSDASGFTTGAELVMDGGFTLQ